MVKATELYEESGSWGSYPKFHAVEYDGKIFNLYENLTLTASDFSCTGKIIDISDTTLSFMTTDRHFKLVKLDEITSLHY